MKWHQRSIASLLGWLGPLLIRLWIGSLRVRQFLEEPEVDPANQLPGKRHIFAIWHEQLLIACYQLRGSGAYTLISQSVDGEYIARVAEGLGWNVIRGSTSRGAAAALRQLVDSAQRAASIEMGITCDGPRGPRRVLKEGVLYVASRTGLAIVPIGVAFDRPWRARSWDRFILPRPFSRTVIVGGRRITVPPDADRSRLELLRQETEAAMQRANAEAQRRLEEWLGGSRAANPPAATPLAKAG